MEALAQAEAVLLRRGGEEGAAGGRRRASASGCYLAAQKAHGEGHEGKEGCLGVDVEVPVPVKGTGKGTGTGTGTKRSGGGGFVPSYVLSAVARSEVASPEARESARQTLGEVEKAGRGGAGKKG